MTDTIEERSEAYRRLISHLAYAWPGQQALHEFVNCTPNLPNQSPPKFTIITINHLPNATKDAHAIKFADFEGTEEITRVLSATENCDTLCRLYVVENICPRTIALLGGHFNIDPQFFADHLDRTPWYRIDNVAEGLPALPSSQNTHDFLRLRYIDARTISNRVTDSSSQEPESERRKSAYGLENNNTSDSKSFMSPDIATTRIPRKAGKLIPRTRHGKNFNSVLCTRQVVTIWFGKKDSGGQGWNGILLLDPPFRLPQGNYRCMPSEQRNFLARPSLSESLEKAVYSHESTRDAFLYHLKTGLKSNPSLIEAITRDAFLILSDVYRLNASSWMVVNEYVNRELATIEYILEKEQHGFQDLEMYLKDLYVFRRRCTMYHELISEAKEQCHSRGQLGWSQSNPSELALRQAELLEQDFAYLQLRMQGTGLRIEKDINLLVALVAIGEGKQGLSKNHGIARITLVATIFLPFSTVAAVLGMQSGFAPGADNFWVFWVIAVPLTALIVGFFVLYDGAGKQILAKLRGWSASREHESVL